jgi:AraC family transcriptional activator of pobA
MKLTSFNLYERLKSYHTEYVTEPFLLVDQNSYEKAAVTFPFRTFTYGIGITYKGEGGVFKIGGVEYETKKGSLITVGPGIASQYLGKCNALHDTIYFTEELFKNSLRTTQLSSLPFFAHGGKHVIQLDAEKMNKIRSMIDLIKMLRSNKEVVAGLVYALIQLTVEFHDEYLHTRKPVLSIQQKMTIDFKSLLSKHFLQHKDVHFYASSLNITPKYLSEVLLSETGKAAKQLINEHILWEAKSLLRQTTMSVQEISYWLGFQESAYFSRAFKKAEGITPLQYRTS